MFGPGRDPSPLVAGQQSIDCRVGYGVADAGLVAGLDAAGGDQVSGFGLLLEGSQQFFLLLDGEVLMAAPAFGAALAGGQAAAQIVRPDAPDMADAQADGFGDGFGGEILLAAKPEALEALERRGGAGGEHGATDRADLGRGNFGARTHRCPHTILTLY